MESWIVWLNMNAAAVSAASTVVLVLITAWYAARTHQLVSLTSRQVRLLERANLPEVKVQVKHAMVPQLGRLQYFLSIEAANTGQRAVTVSMPVLELPGGQHMAFIDGFAHQTMSFPARLEPGSGCSVLVDLATVIHSLQSSGRRGAVELRASFSDNAGHSFRSEKFEFDIEQSRQHILEG